MIETALDPSCWVTSATDCVRNGERRQRVSYVKGEEDISGMTSSKNV
jgi:hypothetical protein